MQKNLSYEELSRLEDIFDGFVKMKDACLSKVQKQESLNDFVTTYRDGDEFETLEQFEAAVLAGDAWAFKCDTSRPDDPTARAEDMEQNASGQTAFSGYKMKTTFWNDFTIADAFGTEAVQNTFDRAFPDWRGDVVYLTELVLVLNWKIYEFYEKTNEAAQKAKDEAAQVKHADDEAKLADDAKDTKKAVDAKIRAEIHDRKRRFNENEAVKFDELAHLYDKLWKLADGYACDNLKGDELAYFYNTTD